jgi:type I restriction enzyme S subunit
MQSETKKIPRLRFPSFSGEWEEKKLGKIATFAKGKGISKDDAVEGGKYKCIRYGELYTQYKEIINEVYSRTNILPADSFLSQKDDVLIPASGETALDIATTSCVKKPGILLGGDINVLRFNKEQSGDFLAYYLKNFKNRDIARLAQGQSVVHLFSSQLKELILNTPTLPEQQKIAGFLRTVNEWIENLHGQKEFLESYKKGMAQKIFTQEIRFKDDGGNEFPKWQEREMGDCLSYEQPTHYIVHSVEYDDSYKTPVLTAGKSFILGYTDETDNIFTSNSPVIIFDDFTTASQFVDFSFKVKSSAMKILKAKNAANIKFMFEAMQQIRYEVGGHGRHWISRYSNIKILVPHIPEQQRIADFLTSIDKLVKSKQEQIAQVEQWKRGLMQGLFV